MKVVEYKINIHKSIAFLHASNKHSEMSKKDAYNSTKI